MLSEYIAICDTCWKDGRRVQEFHTLSGGLNGCPAHGIVRHVELTERRREALVRRRAKLTGRRQPCPGCFSGAVDQARAGTVYCGKCLRAAARR